MRPLALALLVAGCAEFPALDARLGGEATAPPDLLPLDALLAAADAQGAAAPALGATGGVESRAAALEARAAAIRGPVLSGAERARLAAALP